MSVNDEVERLRKERQRADEARRIKQNAEAARQEADAIEHHKEDLLLRQFAVWAKQHIPYDYPNGLSDLIFGPRNGWKFVRKGGMYDGRPADDTIIVIRPDGTLRMGRISRKEMHEFIAKKVIQSGVPWPYDD